MAYRLSNMMFDLAMAVQSRPEGIFSGRPLGNRDNLALWSMDHLDSLYGGIVAVHDSFYADFSMATVSRLVLCIGMQESTGDYALHVPAGTSQGLMQASPASVVADYDAFGQPIPSMHKDLRPGEVDVADPGTSVMLWGWYGHSAAHTGVSVNEYVNREAWNIQAHRARPKLAHALLAWRAGPSATLDDTDTALAYADYIARITDYWVASGFGNQSQLQRLLRRRLWGNVTYVADVRTLLRSSSRGGWTLT